MLVAVSVSDLPRVMFCGESVRINNIMASSVLADCPHYERLCEVNAKCCAKWNPCRLCHNKKNPEHLIDRYNIMRSYYSKPTQKCANCELVFGEYFSPTCNLFDHDTSKLQFHCEGCHLCRLLLLGYSKFSNFTEGLVAEKIPCIVINVTIALKPKISMVTRATLRMMKAKTIRFIVGPC